MQFVNTPEESGFHATLCLMMWPFLLYKHLLHLKDAVGPEMALGWVTLVLLVRGSVALENPQAFNVSQRCMKDTNTFLWEINLDRPEEYAVLSKYCCLLQGLPFR